MNLLTIEHVSKQYSERLLLADVSMQINHGDRIGLIGVNGSGKSTLLRMLAGRDSPDSGRVHIWGGARIEYLAQEPEFDDQLTVLEQIFRSDSPQMRLLYNYERVSLALQHNADDPRLQQEMLALSAELDRTEGWSAEANAKAVLTQLGIQDFDARIGALSGGQRKRVALARAMIDRADLLILDEPTNHIDTATVAWLEEYLATTPGALMMVTHDRYFLDRVVNRIVELDRRQLITYSGNYADYLQARAQRHERLVDSERKRQKLLQRELAWLRRSPMARGTKQKARSQRVAELMQLEYDRGDESVSIALASRRLGKKVLTARGLTKSYGANIVVDAVDFDLEPGDRFGIIGPNGAGKSTLLDLLTAKAAADSGSIQWGETVRVGYYDQRSEGLDDKKRIIEFIEDEAALIRGKDGVQVEAAQMLEWFLFPRAMQWARIGSLSGGERRRLYLLRTLVHQPNVLFLDEPTNDLDVQTLTVLEEYLDHFQGSLLAVSHDRYFLDRTVDYLITMDGGQLGARYPTPYSTYVQMAKEAQPSEPSASSASNEAPSQTARRRRIPRLSWREQKELDGLEENIASLETRKDELLAEMAADAGDYLRLQQLARQLEETENQLDTALERWLLLSELAEVVP